MNIQDIFIVFHAHIPNIFLAVISGIIHQNINRSLFFLNSVCDFLCMIRICDIKLVENCFSAKFLQDLISLLLICPAQCDHFRTGTDQTSCDRKSQAGDSSRHNCCFSGKIIPFLHRKFCFLLFCKSCHDFLQIPYISVISHFRNATSFS